MIDCREIMIVEQTFNNVNLIEQSIKMQTKINMLILTIVVVGISANAMGYYLE